jgi:hypothetical protein
MCPQVGQASSRAMPDNPRLQTRISQLEEEQIVNAADGLDGTRSLD